VFGRANTLRLSPLAVAPIRNGLCGGPNGPEGQFLDCLGDSAYLSQTWRMPDALLAIIFSVTMADVPIVQLPAIRGIPERAYEQPNGIVVVFLLRPPTLQIRSRPCGVKAGQLAGPPKLGPLVSENQRFLDFLFVGKPGPNRFRAAGQSEGGHPWSVDHRAQIPLGPATRDGELRLQGNFPQCMAGRASLVNVPRRES